MKKMVFDEKAIKLLKEYNLRFAKPNLNEIYLQSLESEEHKKTISKFSCVDCNQFPLVAYKCNDQICQKFLCNKCLKRRKDAMSETHDELDLSEVYDCMDCHSLKFSKYDLDKDEELKNLKFLCPNKNPQMIEEIPYADIKNHIENCEFLKLCKCIQCGIAGSEAEMISHIQGCTEAIILCEYCCEETERKFHNIHLNNCEKMNQEINLDSSIASEIEEKNLEQKVECEYVNLTENKIDNLSNNEFVVSSEKGENNSTSEQSENNNGNSAFGNEIENNQPSFDCVQLAQENLLLKEKLDELENKLNISSCSCAEENAKIREKLALLEKQIGNINSSNENPSKGSDWKKTVCSLLLFGMFIQQLIILYLIKNKYTNIQSKKESDPFDIYKHQRMNSDRLKLSDILALQEQLEKQQREYNEKIKIENQRRLNLITKKSGKLEIFFAEKNLKFSSINKQFENKLTNVEKIYDTTKSNLEKNFIQEIQNFRYAIKENKSLIYFLNLKIKEKKLSIVFFQSIELTQKDLKSYKFHKDEKAFIMFSGNKFIFADEAKEAQFFFLDNYFFIIGFNNGGGLYLRNKTLSLNLSKLSDQFKVSKADFNYLEELNGKNLYEHLENLQVYKINSEIEN